jgi:hypothetical protein
MKPLATPDMTSGRMFSNSVDSSDERTATVTSLLCDAGVVRNRIENECLAGHDMTASEIFCQARRVTTAPCVCGESSVFTGRSIPLFVRER